MATYIWGLKNGKMDDHKLMTSVTQRWYFRDSPWFPLARGQYDFNEKRDWKHRFTGHGGIGYDFIEEDNLELYGVLGAGLRQDLGSQNEDTIFEGLVGGGIVIKPTKRQTFDTDIYYYPALSGDRSRYTIGANWSYLLDLKSRVSFNIGLDYEYDTNPDSGFPKDIYYLNFGIQFDY